MKTQELSSKHHPGVLVRYTYRGDFNGGAPKYLEINLVDVKAGGVSIYALLSNAALADLKEEIADAIHPA
jgi:hypothetical protein